MTRRGRGVGAQGAIRGGVGAEQRLNGKAAPPRSQSACWRER